MNNIVDCIALIVVLSSLIRGMQRGLLLALLSVCSVISAPGKSVQGLRDLSNEPKMQTLFSSKQFASDLLSGDTKKIGNNPDLCRSICDFLWM